MLERQHLTILRAIDQFGSLTAAAEDLCLSQSALSHAMKKLESYHGLKLWTQQGRKLHLSEAGLFLLAAAQRIVPQFEHCENILAQLSNGERGQLRIGMECHPCYRWLLKRLALFMGEWPDIDVDVRRRFQFGGIQALLNYDIDLLLTPDKLQVPGINYMRLFDYQLLLVVHKDSSLAQQSYLSPHHLSDQCLVTYPVETNRLDIFKHFLQPAKLLPQRHKTVETTDIMLQMVASGRAVAALPDWLVEESTQGLPVSSLIIGQQGLHKSVHLGIRSGDIAQKALNNFITSLLSKETSNKA